MAENPVSLDQHRAALAKRARANTAGMVRAVERLTDSQLIAAELLIYVGLPDFRIAQRMGLDTATIRRWLREPVFMAACAELTRAYCAGQLVPLGLYRIRSLMSDPFLKIGDAVKATRFVAELAGLTGKQFVPEQGAFAPGPVAAGRPLSELSRDDLHRLMIAGQQAQQRLEDNSAEDIADPLT